MARWYAKDILGEAFGAPFTAPDKRQAIDLGTAMHGPKCESVVSVPEWEEILAQRQADARRKRAKE